MPQRNERANWGHPSRLESAGRWQGLGVGDKGWSTPMVGSWRPEEG